MSATKISFSSGALGPSLTHHQRARAWADVIGEGRGWDVDCPNPDGFQAHVEMIGLPGMRIVRAAATSIRLTRARRHVQADNADNLELVINDGGAGIGATLSGRDHTLRVGDALLLDFSAPHSSHAARGGRSLGLTLTRRYLETTPGGTEALARGSLDRSLPALGLLRSYLTLLLGESRPMTEEVAQAASRHVMELVTLAIGAARAEQGAPERIDATSAARVALLIDAIGRRCAEHALDAGTVGQPHGLSGRTLQHLLQQAGTTFTDELREARLSRALALLQSTLHLERSIASIAYECGFADLSTFNRAVRARFGCTPGDLRAKPARS